MVKRVLGWIFIVVAICAIAFAIVVSHNVPSKSQVPEGRCHKHGTSIVCPRCGAAIFVPKAPKHEGPGMPPPAMSPEQGPACGGCPNAQPGQAPEGGCHAAKPGQAPEGGCPAAQPGHGPGNGGPAPMPGHGPGNGGPAPAPAPNGAPVPPPGK